MDIPKYLNKWADTACSKKTKCNEELKKLYVGKEAVIVCPHFNGQPYGSSAPKLKGRTVRITDAFVDIDSPVQFYFSFDLQSLKDPTEWRWMGSYLSADQITKTPEG